MEHRNITFIGAGNMTHSIIAGLIASGYPKEKITATNPSTAKLENLKAQYGINITTDNLAATLQADVVVLAVKPQIMANVADELRVANFSNKLVISIAAGISVQRFTQMFTTTLNLIRVMPNTPALVGRGMSGLFAVEGISKRDKAFAADLLSSVGEICWVEKEPAINSVIAAAGSAPAYFFLFMEAIQTEAIAQGFDQDTARLLVQQVALGSAEMVIANPDISLSTLRQQVTSKGGTTAEALHIFNQYDLQGIVAKAMQAAVSRAEEMESLF